AGGPAGPAGGRSRAAARAGRTSWPDGSPVDLARPHRPAPDRPPGGPVPRPPRPDDLYRLRVATEPRLSPDGGFVAVTLQTVAPTYDAYRTALWLVATAEDGPPPRRLTLGARHDRHPRFSPD